MQQSEHHTPPTMCEQFECLQIFPCCCCGNIFEMPKLHMWPHWALSKSLFIFSFLPHFKIWGNSRSTKLVERIVFGQIDVERRESVLHDFVLLIDVKICDWKKDEIKETSDSQKVSFAQHGYFRWLSRRWSLFERLVECSACVTK